MRAWIALAAFVPLTLSPAEACHRFSVWKYPTPQRCSVARLQVDRSWSVEIERLPDDLARELAIEQLKGEMAK